MQKCKPMLSGKRDWRLKRVSASCSMRLIACIAGWTADAPPPVITSYPILRRAVVLRYNGQQRSSSNPTEFAMATTRTMTNAWVDRKLPDIFYEEPERVEDGMEQDLSIQRISHLLFERYKDRSDVFCSGRVFISYDESNGNRRVGPDFFIAFDVDDDAIRANLPNFWIWETGKVPDFALEVASPSTASNDLGRKRELYAELGVTEYWRFDATGGEHYGQPLAGERLVEGEYQPYELQVDDDGSVRAYSELLDVDFYWDGHEFDVLDPETGRTIDKYEVEREARLAAEARERELLDEIDRLRRRLDG